MASGLLASSSISAQGAEALERVLAPYAGASRPGVAVAVVRTDQPLLTAAVGMADIDAGTPATPSTVFRAASVSKQFTAFAVALLESEGALDKSQPVSTYLPELGRLGDDVTVGQLIHHTAGVKDYLGLAALAGRRPSDPLSVEEIVALIAGEGEPRHGPGEMFLYSNSHYVLLGAIVERLTGEPLARFLETRVFGPAGMRSTRVVGTRTADMAVPYLEVDGSFLPAPEHSVIPGPEGAATTVVDMAAWARVLITGTLGGRDVHRRLHEVGRLRDGSEVPYSYGLSEEADRGLRQFGHGGSGPGWECSIRVYPDQGVAVIVMANSAVPAGRIAREIAESLLADRMTLAPDPRAGLPPGGIFIDPEAIVRPSESDGMPGDTARYEVMAGRYHMAEGPDLVVSTDGLRLFLSIDHESPPVELFPVPGGRYRFVPAAWDLSFHLTPGERERLTLHLTEASVRRGPTRDVSGMKAEEAGLSPEELVLFTGCYRNQGLNTSYTVVARGETLVLQHPVLGPMDLIYRRDDIFAVSVPPLRRAEFFHDDPADLTTPVVALRLGAVAFGVSADFVRCTPPQGDTR